MILAVAQILGQNERECSCGEIENCLKTEKTDFENCYDTCKNAIPENARQCFDEQQKEFDKKFQETVSCLSNPTLRLCGKTPASTQAPTKVPATAAAPAPQATPAPGRRRRNSEQKPKPVHDEKPYEGLQELSKYFGCFKLCMNKTEPEEEKEYEWGAKAGWHNEQHGGPLFEHLQKCGTVHKY